MKEYRYDLQTEGLIGHVVVKVPNYKERMALMKEMIDFKKVSGSDVASGVNIEKILEVGYEKLKEALVEMEVKVDGDDQVFTDLESFSYYAEFQDFLIEVGALMQGGIRLGKKQQTPS